MPALAGIIFLIGFLVFSHFAPKLSPSARLLDMNFFHNAPSRNKLGVLQKIDAQSAVVLDKESGYRVFDYNADEVRSIASLTKLMTALVFLDHNPGWDKSVTMQKSDMRSGAKANLFVGDRLSVSDLFSVALVASDNSAIIALVRSSGLSEEDFVQAMNEKAQALHLRDMNFVDPTGLEPDNKGSALSVAKLLEKALEQSDIASRLKKRSFDVAVSASVSRHINATNQLLGRDLPGDATMIGAKTGHLDEAGYCFAAIFETDKRRLISVVLGAPIDEKRFSETIKILDWTMKAYLWEN